MVRHRFTEQPHLTEVFLEKTVLGVVLVIK